MKCLRMASLMINIKQTGFHKSVLLHFVIRVVTAQLERHYHTTIILKKGCPKKSKIFVMLQDERWIALFYNLKSEGSTTLHLMQSYNNQFAILQNHLPGNDLHGKKIILKGFLFT